MSVRKHQKRAQGAMDESHIVIKQKYVCVLVSGEVFALRAHCVHTAHAEAGILTQAIRLVMTVLFPRNPFQKNEQSKNV